MATAPDGDLLIYQYDLDRAFRLRHGDLAPAGPGAVGAKAMLASPADEVWLLSKAGLIREQAAGPTPEIRVSGRWPAVVEGRSPVSRLEREGLQSGEAQWVLAKSTLRG